MSEDMYSVEQVADRLGLHVRTVRGYIRDGKLNAVRIGKQYRISRADLDAFTGGPRSTPAVSNSAPQLEVSSIMQIDGVDRTAADRLATLVLAGANTASAPQHPLRIQTIYDDEQNRMKIVVLGGAAATADVLRLVDAVLDSGNGLFIREAGNA